MNNGKLDSLWFNYQGLFPYLKQIFSISEKSLSPKPQTTPDKCCHSLILCYLTDFLYIYLCFD